MRNPMGNAFNPSAHRANERIKLPAGLYIAKIKGVKDDGSALIIRIDIAEGEYAGFFERDYAAQNSQYARYHGDYRMTFADGKDQRIDGIRNDIINDAIHCVEASNAGFKWNWDTVEKTIAGKIVGINVRERDWVMEDRNNPGEVISGTSTEIGRFESVDDVREGKVKVMKKRELSKRDKERMNNVVDTAMTGMTPVEVSEIEIPF